MKSAFMKEAIRISVKMMRRGQGGRGTEGLRGEGAVLFVAGRERECQTQDADCRQNMIAHGCSSHIAIQPGKRADVHAIRHEIRVTQAVQAYWELEFAWRNLGVQTEAVRLAEQQDASNRRQVEQGLLAPVDVVQTQTQIATFQQNLFSAQNALTSAENALKVLMLSDRTDLMWGMSLEPEQRPDTRVDLPSLPDAVKMALAGRPELKQSEPVQSALNQLFKLAQSVPDFDSKQFADALQKFSAALAGPP